MTGAHLNPAVTLALAAHRRFPWGKVLPYSIAQLMGAFVASAVVFVTYHEAINAFVGGVRQVVGAQPITDDARERRRGGVHPHERRATRRA